MALGDALADLWREAGGEPEALGDIALIDDGPVLPSTFAVDLAATVAVGASTLAAARLWHQRRADPSQPTEEPSPRVTVGSRESAVAFRSERYLRVPDEDLGLGDRLTGDYETGDGWIRLHCNYPDHRAAVLRVLGVGEPDVPAAVRRWSAGDLEEAVALAGGAAAALRSAKQWTAHPQGVAVAGLPLIGRRRLGDSGPGLSSAGADRPLAGVRVLDLTRVIAGPVAGRTLAAHGADVLRVGADHLALVPALVVDTGFGKRFTHLDLRTPGGVEALRELIARVDVVLQAFRPGALAARGFGPDECAALRPGLVYVDISAWGPSGPWRDRRGFDSLVQVACGIADEGRIAAGDPTGRPRALPAQVLDHATGYLAALGAIQALRHRQATGGGSHVEVSLARTAHWSDQLGRVPRGLETPDPTSEAVADLLLTDDTPFGSVTHVRPPGLIDGAALRWSGPPHRPGADPPRWLASETAS